MVVERGPLQKIHRATGCAAFGIGRAKDDAVDSAMDKRAGAHGAGFFGDVEGAVGEAPIADGGLGGGEGDHLGVGGGVLEQFDLVPRAGDDRALAHDHRAHGHFIGLVSLHRLAEGVLHEMVVGHDWLIVVG